MSYKVLYRKYRPNTFDSLIGQDNIVTMLTNSIINDKISHAYIFSGPRGTGKTSTSKIFAKSINCLSPIDGNPCNECINCINGESSSDIIEIDAASNNGVDEIREITNNIKLAPNSLKYKVYIIDEVHMLSQSAFNALLLTLEEPPGHVVFILATTNVESVPITILSRCQRFDFKKINNKDIEDTIKRTCDMENIKISDEAVREIAYLADGGLRDCLSLLDQLSKENKEIDVNMVNSSIGNISMQNINIIINSLEESDFDALTNKIEELSLKNTDLKLFIKGLIEGISIKVKNIIINNEVSNFGIAQYKKVVLELSELINNLNISVDGYTILQIILLSYFSKETTVNLVSSNIVKDVPSINKIENNDNNIIVKEEKKKDINYKQLINIRINNCFVRVSKDEKNKHLEVWQEFIVDSDTKIKGLIMDSSVVASSLDITAIQVERENDLDKIYDNLDLINELYKKYSKQDVKLIFLSTEMWVKYSKEYINNIKNGVKYNIMQEVMNNELLDIADDIFARDKIEER